MATSKSVLPSDFDPDGPAPADSGIYGLPFSAEDSRVVVVPVPFEATTSYGGGTSKRTGRRARGVEAGRPLRSGDRDARTPAGIAMLDVPKKVVRWNAEAKKHGRAR